MAQKEIDFLYLILKEFKGSIYKNKNRDVSMYFSTAIPNLPKIINYFDSFSLLSTKFINYIQWRKTAKLILKKEHLTLEGFIKIEKIKNNFNSKLKIFYYKSDGSKEQISLTPNSLPNSLKKSTLWID